MSLCAPAGDGVGAVMDMSDRIPPMDLRRQRDSCLLLPPSPIGRLRSSCHVLAAVGCSRRYPHQIHAPKVQVGTKALAALLACFSGYLAWRREDARADLVDALHLLKSSLHRPLDWMQMPCSAPMLRCDATGLWKRRCGLCEAISASVEIWEERGASVVEVFRPEREAEVPQPLLQLRSRLCPYSVCRLPPKVHRIPAEFGQPLPG